MTIGDIHYDGACYTVEGLDRAWFDTRTRAEAVRGRLLRAWHDTPSERKANRLGIGRDRIKAYGRSETR